MDDAPNPNPATVVALLSKTTNMRVTPNSANPTTDSPITAPLLKATRKAGFNPSIACTVVRVFALTAIVIPINPASADPIAPTKYAIAVPGTLPTSLPVTSTTRPVTSKSINTANTIAITTTKIARSLYSRERKAIAPSCIALPIAWICSLPSSFFRTLEVRYPAKAKETNEATNATICICSIFFS